MSLFRKFTECLDVVFPSREALAFISNYQALAEINVLANKHFRDERLSMRGIPPKLRAITDEFLKSRGITVKVEPISILDEDFQKAVTSRNRTKTEAAEIEHAIRHHLDVELDDRFTFDMERHIGRTLFLYNGQVRVLTRCVRPTDGPAVDRRRRVITNLRMS